MEEERHNGGDLKVGELVARALAATGHPKRAELEAPPGVGVVGSKSVGVKPTAGREEGDSIQMFNSLSLPFVSIYIPLPL